MFESARAIPVDRLRGTGFRARTVPFAMLSLAILSTGCMLHKKQARVFVPPPPPRSKTANLKLPPILDPPDVRIETEGTPKELAMIGFGITEFPPPPQPAPPARRPQPAKPAAPPVASEMPATPKIAQIFTPEQLRENVKALDDSLDHVQRALETLGKRNLTAEQRDRVGQIHELEMQAKQAREQDLVTAVSLAKRADALAKDLLDRLP